MEGDWELMVTPRTSVSRASGRGLALRRVPLIFINERCLSLFEFNVSAEDLFGLTTVLVDAVA